MAVAAAIVGTLIAGAGAAATVQANRSQRKVIETQKEEAEGRVRAANKAEQESYVNRGRARDVAKRGSARRASGVSSLLGQGANTATASTGAASGAKSLLGQ